MRVVLGSMLLLSAVTAPGYGQGLQAEKADVTPPAYDVMSIKPNKSGSGSVGVDSNNDTYQATNVSLANLLENAYGIKRT